MRREAQAGHEAAAPRLPRSWLVGLTLRRWRTQWRLIVAVTLVALVACTLVTALGLLVTASERAGVRGSLAALDAGQSALDVRILKPSGSVEHTRTSLEKAVGRVLGDAGTADSRALAFSQPTQVTAPLPIAASSGADTFAYFGELDDVTDHASLIAGRWPRSADARGPLPVALPQAAAQVFGLTVGKTVAVANADGTTTTATVVGVYRATDAAGEYWSRDVLHGDGENPVLPRPGSSFGDPIDAFGPLVTAPGGLDEAGIAASVVDVSATPRFQAVTVDQLAPLMARLDSADVDIARYAGNIASGIYYSSSIDTAVSGVVSGLVVTRATVTVVSLLLIVLAVAAMTQMARVYTDARESERRLMRSRGASTRDIVALTAIEAGVIGVVTALAAAPLAALVYRALAAQPPMVAAGMPADAAPTPLTWLSAFGVAALFVLVLLLPLFRARGEAESGADRRQRLSPLMRSGLDVGVLALAVLAYWQLQLYRSPVRGEGELGVDPVLALGPALLLLAGALIAARLIPLVSVLADRLGSRVRGAVLPLAAWEIGRRARRATAAVLLLSLTLAVGTFCLSFLATWKQSQLDQAALAVGAPVRVAADPAEASRQAARLAVGAARAPQPVIHDAGRVAGSDADAGDGGSTGVAVRVLGLTEPARAMLDRGRVGAEGGTRIASTLHASSEGSRRIALPSDASAITARVSVARLDGVTADVRAIVEDVDGLLRTVDFGAVDADGSAYDVSASLIPAGADDAATATEAAGAARPPASAIVGFQAELATTSGESGGSAAKLSITVGDLGVRGAGQASARVLTVGDASPWYATMDGVLSRDVRATPPPPGWQYAIEGELAGGVGARGATVVLAGWEPSTMLRAVVPHAFASSLSLTTGESLTLLVHGRELPIRVAGTAAHIPGAATLAELAGETASAGASSGPSATVVVDEVALARALAQAGVTGTLANEWWVDVPAAHATAYVHAHTQGTDAPAAASAAGLALALQQAPLRVATQAALWLGVIASAVLAAIGFMVHTTQSLRTRRLELGHLRALGLSRRALTALVALEATLLCVLGTVFGVGLGLLLVNLVGPLVAVSPTGAPTVPSVVIATPWAQIGMLALEIAIVLAALVALIAQLQRTVRPAELLREGGEQ
ncbi:ABC transporter permease [Microbacterium sp. STN6]|uniref:ABC transporter permease n=1 Tax=Microbacterium sp. STN6 TaxID=2995588 RepID=UPI002260E208|nr:ABC transporter permease [Microbacterium sp. STN6]MCX7522320.1 ABC transporter permease [Microbacterium sp. STN6]